MLDNLFCAIGILIFVMSFVKDASAQQPEFIPGEVVIKWKHPAEEQPHRMIGSGYSVRRLEQQTKKDTLKTIQALASSSQVAVAEPNYIRRTFRVPNDPHYNLQWYAKTLGLEKAWDITTGRKEIVVAVVDTGILPEHPDLQGRLLPGRDFISNEILAGDDDGWDDDPRDVNMGMDNSAVFHGTHVAGIIGAASDNQIGVIGVDWNCKILPVRAIASVENEGTDSDIASAIRWAAGLDVPGVPPNSHPAQIINLSFGGPGYSRVLEEAIEDAMAQGCLVVAAAGNQGIDGRNIYPAAIPGVITVGATQLDGKRASYSNFGKIIDIMAPGGNLEELLPIHYMNHAWHAGIIGPFFLSDINKFTYQMFDGTSVAAPQIAGILSLMLSIDPSLDQNAALAILRRSSIETSRCKEGCGMGLVNAGAAIEELDSMTHAKEPGVVVGIITIGCNWSRQSSEQSMTPLVLALLFFFLLIRKLA